MSEEEDRRTDDQKERNQQQGAWRTHGQRRFRAGLGRWGGAFAVELLKQLLPKPSRLTVACPHGARVCGEGWVRRCRAECLLTCVDPSGRSTPLLPASLAPPLISPSLLCVPPLGKPTSVIKAFQHLLGAGAFAIWCLFCPGPTYHL